MIMGLPFFTIITVCYNSEKTIARTIESVVNQTDNDLEYILVDGKSTDDTLKIIESYASKDPRIMVISEPDRGIYDAMNKGISQASGTLIGIVNSDDYYELDALEQMKIAYQGEKYEILYGMQRNIMPDGRINSIVFYHHDFMNDNMICHPTCFITRKLYEDLGKYSLEYKASSDYDFMLNMSRNPQVIFTPVYHIISNFSYGGMSGSVDAHIETFKIWRKYGCISKKRYWMIYLSTKVKQLIG